MPKLTDAELLKMMELSGYDASLVHPSAFSTFSWKSFADRVSAAVSERCAKIADAELPRDGHHLEMAQRIAATIRQPGAHG